MGMGSFYDYNTMLYMNQFYYQSFAVKSENLPFGIMPDQNGNIPATNDTDGNNNNNLKV